MSKILFDEKERFDELFEEDDGFAFTQKDFMILIKMYRYLGKKDNEINKYLYDNFHGVHSDRINKAFKAVRGLMYEPAKEITIYKEELDVIQGQLDYDLQKLMFILLCLCKFENNKNKNYLYFKTNGNISLTKILQCAKVKAINRKKKIKNFVPLSMQGYIDTINGELQILYYRDNGTPIMKFVPYNDMIYEYRSYIGDRVVRCAECGKWIYKRGNKTKYCSSCAKVVKNRQTAEIVKERRMLENRKQQNC